MITLELQDGRRFSFEADAAIDAQPSPSNELLEISSITYEDFNQSFSPKDGADFLIKSANRPDTIYVIELKTGRFKSPVKQLTDRAVQRAIHSVMPGYNNSDELEIHRQLWAVNLSRHLIFTFEANADGALGRRTAYKLTQVENQNSEESADSIVDKQDVISTHSLIRRIDNWETRIRNLYSLVGEWVEEIDGAYTTDDQDSVVMNEELMRRYGISPRQLPVLSIKKDGELVATIKPYGLWTIGSNGRIDLYSPKLTGFIVDRSEPYSSPIWQLYGSNDKRFRGKRIRDGVNFDQASLKFVLGA